MKRPVDEELDISFKKLNQSLRIKPTYHEQLKTRIMEKCENPVQRRSSRRKLWLLGTAAILILLISSPFYSTTMASLAAKVIPLKIVDQQETNMERLHTLISQMIEKEGYAHSSIGTTPNPFTIQIELLKDKHSLSNKREVLEPKIEQVLADHGIDQYRLKITQANIQNEKRNSKDERLFDRAGEIISDAFLAYGYPEIAQKATYGLNNTLISHQLEIEMPDHIKEDKKIKKYVLDAIKEEKLDIKGVKLNYYNVAHRDQNNRGARIASNIYDSLAGKSKYQVVGISYKVKNNVTYVWIKSDLTDATEKQTIDEIGAAIHEYLTSDKMRDIIQKDGYEIQLLGRDQITLLKIVGSSKR